MNWIFILLGLCWVSVFTSQSLVDLSDILIVGTGLTWVTQKKDWKIFFSGLTPTWLWPLWIGIILVGLLLNRNLSSPATWGDLFEFRWILTFLAGIYIFRNFSEKSELIKNLGFLILLLNTLGFVLWLQDTEGRAGGLLGSSMSFAHNLAPIFCFFSIFILAEWSRFKNDEKVFYSLVTLTSGLMVVLTFTRGVWIGSAVAIFVATFVWNKKLFLAAVLGSVAVFAVCMVSSQRFADRVLNRTYMEKDSNQERTALWKGNWEMVKDYPIFGVGLGANKSHLRKYYDTFQYPASQRQSHAHNQYLQYWAGTGTLGLICFLIFLFLTLRYAFQSFKQNQGSMDGHLQLALYAAMICFLMGSLTESNFNIAKNRFLFIILASMAVGWAHKIEKKS